MRESILALEVIKHQENNEHGNIMMGIGHNCVNNNSQVTAAVN